MKNLLFMIAALSGLAGLSQNKQVLYGLEEVPQALLLNPGGIVPQKAHFGIPFLSQIHVSAGASGVSVYDVFGESTVNINTRIGSIISRLGNDDFFTATQQLDLINFGWRARNEIYFSGGIYQELDFISYFPKDLALLAWHGNRDYLNYEFDLGGLSASGDLLTVYHFGANKRISKKLTVGLRAKIYNSMISFRSVNNRGTFVTRLGGEDSPNIYEHYLQNAEVSVQTSGYAPLRELDGSSAVTSEILGRSLFSGNMGVGIDLGATYEINGNWVASASILDVGAIFHNRNVETYRLHGSSRLDGIELIFPPLSEGESTFPYYEDLEDEIENDLPLDTLNASYSQLRPAKMYASLKYGFGRPVDGGSECDCLNMDGGRAYNQAIGLQYFNVFRPKGMQMAGTLFYYRRFADFLSAKATYTIDSYSNSNVGLGAVVDIGKFNFYIAADNLLKYGNIAKAKCISLQLGFNIKIAEE